MIKDYIKKLIDGYEQNFFEKTGLKLIASVEFVEVKKIAKPTKKVPIDKIIEKAERFHNLEEGTITTSRSRKVDILMPRSMVIMAAYEQGYTQKKISSYITLTRSSIARSIAVFTNEISVDKDLRVKYIEFKKFISKVA